MAQNITYTLFIQLAKSQRVWLQRMFDSNYSGLWLTSIECNCVEDVLGRDGYSKDDREILNGIVHYYKEEMGKGELDPQIYKI